MNLTWNGVLVKIRYLTFTKEGLPYYQRKYPKALLGHPSLTSTHHKVRLHAPANDEVALLEEIKQVNDGFNTYVELLKSSNTKVLQEVALEKKARSYLKAHRLDVGIGSTLPETERNNFELRTLSAGLFDEVRNHDAAEMDAEQPLPKTELTQVQERAWTLLMKAPVKGTSTAMLSDAWEHYVQEAKLDVDQREGRRLQTIWDRFIGCGGDDQFSEVVIHSRLRTFAELRAKDGCKASTITRQTTTIITALKTFNDHLELDFNIDRPRIPKAAPKTKDKRAILSHKEQITLIELLEREADWKELYCLVALQTGTHPTEIKNLTIDSFNFEHTTPTILLSPNGTGKTQERERIVPIVYRADRIKQLVQNGALEELANKKADNISQQIGKLLKRIQPKASAYSLRHTLRHNADAAGVEGLIQAQLGGWSSSITGFGEHMFHYGQGGADFEERIAPLAISLKKCLKHLPD